MVPPFPGQPTDILVDISQERVTLPDLEQKPTLKRHRREVINLLEEKPELKINNKSSMNLTESELLKLLINISNTKNESSKLHEASTMESLNSTVKNALTADQFAILRALEQVGLQNSKGLMSQVISCVMSLSFIRCMGIFVWPVITSAVPSLLGLPFGRSTDNGIEGVFGMSMEDLEKELFIRKAEMEHTLLDWYRSLTEAKFETTYGYVKFEGYGDGEIGIKLAGGREGRARIKDHKNLPSILTIISDIMEDVLDTGKSNQEKLKKDNKRRGKDLTFPLDEESERSNNDDNIINMFLEKLRSNVTDDDLKYGNRRFTPEDAYRAFEVLFGSRLKARLANKLESLYENNIEPTYENYAHQEQKPSIHLTPKVKVVPLEVQEKKTNLFDEIQVDQENLNRNKFSEDDTMKSALIIHLPKLEDEIISRKMATSIANLARHIKKENMMQMMPGAGFLITFILQMALAHARATASMASMLSNMAMGTAVFSLVRQTLFGQTTHPKIKYVYDTDVVGPGISWPQG